jgi:hypothetical protein
MDHVRVALFFVVVFLFAGLDALLRAGLKQAHARNQNVVAIALDRTSF